MNLNSEWKTDLKKIHDRLVRRRRELEEVRRLQKDDAHERREPRPPEPETSDEGHN